MNIRPFGHPSWKEGNWDSGMNKPWDKLVYNKELRERARQLRKAGVLSEVLFWQQVKGKKLGVDFDRQKIIGNYIVDFYCYEIGIIVEIDGISHRDKGEYDQKRDEYLESYGLKILHIPDQNVKQNMNNVIDWLEQELLKRKRQLEEKGLLD
jgi:very-short-patch-repair endonuclease